MIAIICGVRNAGYDMRQGGGDAHQGKPAMKTRTLFGLGAAAIVLGIGLFAFHARSQDRQFGPPFMQDGPGGMMHHGFGPGMMGAAGDAATAEQLRIIHTLFVAHDRIKRTVTNIPDGIRTETSSDDPEIAALLKNHAADMMKRVEAGSDPGLPIESDALHAIFRNKDKIRTTTQLTENGVIVVQTSDDPRTVATLQEHAGQVSDFVTEGMTALHTAMMRRSGGRMPGGMMGHGMMHGPL
jgi:hypothetical protein